MPAICCYRPLLPLLLLLLLSLDFAALGGRVPADKCPQPCSCHGRSINCKSSGLRAVPADLPPEVERLNLKSNLITRITRNDFKHLHRLRILQMQSNRIRTIEPGAFDSMPMLERLRLNGNRLRAIPDNLFANTPRLYRLDISYNQISFVGKGTLAGAPALRNLQMDHNRIRCITESALKPLHRLETLTLNDNNISSLPANVFRRMPNLRTLRLADNNLTCDCHLAWLGPWLYNHPRLGLRTNCEQPPFLKGQQVVEVDSKDFQCAADHKQLYPSDCFTEKGCPSRCTCQEDVVHCEARELSDVPQDIPDTVQLLHLERNSIARIRANAFSDLKDLGRLYLHDNRISRIDPGAFAGLTRLYSLNLMKNNIRELPRGIFRGLRQLQVVLLDTNQISCVPVDTFAEAENLAILSLHNNRIQALADGTFAAQRRLVQLSVFSNPLVCDCNLRWLNDYLQSHRNLDTRNIACAAPRRMARKKLGETRSRKFRCRRNEADRTRNAGHCELFSECPRNCKCRNRTVDCSWRRLRRLPTHLPQGTTHLKLDNNMIKELPANSILSKLPHLESIDLSSNLITVIQPGSFRRNEKLQVLDISNNKLADLDTRMLGGLQQLRVLQASNNKVTCLNNDTFLLTQELRLLSLSQNEIRCIMEGTFSPLRKLKALHVDMNPLHCNCHMRWLPQFTVANFPVLRHSPPQCRSPPLLRGTPAYSLQPKHFVCSHDSRPGCHGVPPCCSADAVSCDPRALCPAGCECDATTVRCSGIGLTDLPQPLPVDTTHLFLARNRIEHLNTTRLAALQNLKFLDISYNRLRGLKANMFGNLSNLESLIVSFNQITCIESQSFSGLAKLRVLLLQGNRISSLPYGSFDDLTQLITIAVNENPINCDCNVKWLIDFFRRRSLDNGLAQCERPAAMKDKFIFHSRPEDFQCSGESPSVPQCNACHSSPCANGGTCQPVSFDTFRCSCARGFVGDTCSTRIDACFGSPCANGAECQPLGRGRYRCHCAPGFSGANCRTNIDDCVGHRCLNNATCVDGVGGYNCSCRLGFRGRYCQTEIRYCVQDNPCSSGATCLPHPADGYRCVCPAGWEGRNCEVNTNDCRFPTVCRNGGTCVDEVGSFSCRCRPGYTGRLCETLQLPSDIVQLPDLVQRGVCTRHECLNGGRCVQQGEEYRCHCVQGYEGKKCEKLTQVGFYSDSYASIAAWSVFPHCNISLLVATKQRYGVLLYLGSESSFLMMSLFDGFVRFSYSLGVAPGANAYSFQRVNDGEFHSVTAVLQRENLSVSVGGHGRNISAQLSSEADAGISGPIYLGTLPADKLAAVRVNVNIRETFSFGGCVKRMHVNGRLVNFKMNRAASHRLVDGCPSFSRTQDPCKKRTLCRNRGRCRPRPDLPDGFKCLCRPNFSGKRCEEKTCKRLSRRAFYTDPASGCQSRRKLKIRRCLGTCPKSGGYCCQPKRVKHRLIRFHCPNGRRFTKRVTMVRRCGCKPCGSHNAREFWRRLRQ